MIDPQYHSQKRHDILQSIKKLDQEITSLNQQKQKLLRELKSVPIDKPCVDISEDFTLDKNIWFL